MAADFFLEFWSDQALRHLDERKNIIPTSIKDKWTPKPPGPTATTTCENQMYPLNSRSVVYFHLFFLSK